MRKPGCSARHVLILYSSISLFKRPHILCQLWCWTRYKLLYRAGESFDIVPGRSLNTGPGGLNAESSHKPQALKLDQVHALMLDQACFDAGSGMGSDTEPDMSLILGQVWGSILDQVKFWYRTKCNSAAEPGVGFEKWLIFRKLSFFVPFLDFWDKKRAKIKFFTEKWFT